MAGLGTSHSLKQGLIEDEVQLLRRTGATSVMTLVEGPRRKEAGVLVLWSSQGMGSYPSHPGRDEMRVKS